MYNKKSKKRKSKLNTIKPKISFVLAIYNAERTIKECVNSILNQDYPKKDYEIIISDGGSKDKTLEIIKKFMKKNKNIKIVNNLYKFSEGKGMGRDMGNKKARGEILIQLDHDNILENKNWLKSILFPFKDNPRIEVVQSLLTFTEKDSSFIKYINSLGVEDAFASPYNLVSQISLYPKKFKLIKNQYFVYELNPKKVLYAGANGCAFKKNTLKKINGWTRDVDVFADLAQFKTKVAVIKKPRIIHKTTADLYSFLKKKAIYFNRFIQEQYKTKSFKWVEKDFSGKIKFILMVLYNLSIIGPLFVSIKQFYKTKRNFWFWHPIALYLITLEYSLITLLNIKNFFSYAK